MIEAWDWKEMSSNILRIDILAQLCLWKKKLMLTTVYSRSLPYVLGIGTPDMK